MKNSKAVLAGLGLALAAITAPAAYAAVDISHAPQALQFLDGTADFGSAFRANQRGSVFADIFTFDVPGSSQMESTLTSISSTASTGLDITDFTVRDSHGVVVAQGLQESQGDIDIWTIYGAALTPGHYWLQVNGSMVSNTGGSFAGNLNLTPAVPEPETWAMMLGGLSVLGALARRRKQA